MLWDSHSLSGSLWWQKVWKKGEGLGFNRGLERVERELWNSKSTGTSTGADGGDTGEGD